MLIVNIPLFDYSIDKLNLNFEQTGILTVKSGYRLAKYGDLHIYSGSSSSDNLFH